MAEVAKGFALVSGLRSNGFPVKATGTFDFATSIPAEGETVVIGSVTYTFTAALSSAYDVLIGTDADESAANLLAAINKAAGEGTLYATGTVEHPDVDAVQGTTADEIDATAEVAGVVGNAIVTTSTVSGASWGGATLAGGLDGGVWRTPIVLGANDGLEVKTEGITMDAQLINSDGASGARSRVSGDRGNELHAGDVNFDMKYRGYDVLMALGLGEVADPVQQGGEDVYLHVFKVGASLDGLMGTLAFNKVQSIWEYPSIKVNSLTLSVSAGGIMEITANLVCSNLNRNRFAGSNNFTTITTITIPAERQFVLFQDLNIWMKAQDDAENFTDTNKIYPNSFEITLNNNILADDVTTRYHREIDEGAEDGFFDVTGSIGFSKYETEKFVDASQTKAKQNIKAEFLREDLLIPGSTQNASMTLYLPETQISVASPNMSGPGLVQYTAEFTAARALVDQQDVPTGYFDSAVVIELINGRVTNPIASV